MSQATQQTKHRTTEIDGLDIFYREAGPANAPTVLLLHGFPTSSHMFRNLIPRLSDRFHLVAPDYPRLRRERDARPEGLRLLVRQPGRGRRPLR